MRAGTGSEKKSHHLSSLLSPEENQQIWALLDKNCLSLSTCVVQLFTTKAPDHSAWLKQCTGALSLVKDSNKRSYFCRIFCLMRNELVWEHELYSTIEFKKPRPYLINFEGETGQVALNFAAEDEADHFFRFATKMMESRQRRRQRNAPPPRPTSNPPMTPGESDVVLRNQSNQSKVPAINMAPAFNVPMNKGATMGGGGSSSGMGGSSRRGPRKIDKADISGPTNFKHVVHIGWNEQKGFDLTGDEVKTLRPFLEKAGVSERQLCDRDTRDFIYEFVKTNNVLEKVAPEADDENEPESMTSQSSNKSRPPPPVPSRGNNSHRTNGTRTAPPPPPPSNRLLQSSGPRTPPQSSQKARPPPPGRPSPPVPQNNNNNNNHSSAGGVPAPPAPPPPPPPPPPPSFPVLGGGGGDTGGVPEIRAPPAAPDARGALLDEIRKGAMLKKVASSSGAAVAGGAASASSQDSRSDLMQEIRQRKELRPVSEREVNRSSSGEGTDALADALRRALQERGRVIRSSDEDSCTSSDNDGEWDE